MDGSRIAGHLLKAQRCDEAFDYVVRAANEADLRFAFTDAAQWNRTAADLCDGLPSLTYRCRAIEKFEKAGQPAEAAADCEKLLSHTQTLESSWAWRMIHLRCAHNWLQCGRFVQVRKAIENAQSIALDFRSSSLHPLPPSHPLVSFVRDSEPICRTMHQRLYLIDDELAETTWKLSLQTMPMGDPIARKHLQSDLHLARSIRGNLLQRNDDLRLPVESSIDTRTMDQLSDLARQACQDWLHCDWQSAMQKMSLIKPQWNLVSADDLRFSPTLLTMVETWSNLWLGRLADQSKNYRHTFVKIRERNDEFLRRCLLSGVGVASLLIHDHVDLAREIHSELGGQMSRPKAAWGQLWEGFSPILRLLYQDRVSRGLRYLNRMLYTEVGKRLRQVQMVRILYRQLEATLYLRLSTQRPVMRAPSLARVQQLVNLLEAEQNEYANVVASFLQAQQLEMDGDAEQSLALYRQTGDAADPLGLVPLALAAQDRIASIRGGNDTNELKRYLTGQHVAQPEGFARLYCGITR